jgi:hypothetical protein
MVKSVCEVVRQPGVDGEVRLRGGATTRTMIFLFVPSNLVPERKLGNQTLILKNKYRE